MNRTATWATVGTDVSNQTSVPAILETARLNYTVAKEPIYLSGDILVPGKMATVKVETRQPIGVVSSNYEVYQNADAFSFLEEIPNIEFVRAGETHKGMVYIIGKLPELKVMDDQFTPYVIFQTSHNGAFSLRATICPLRIVCQNQFAMSFREMNNTISIKHSSKLESNIIVAQQLLKDTAIYMQGFTNTAEELAMLKINSNDYYRIVDAFFDSTKAITERQKNMLLERRTQFDTCYMSDDNSNFKGTAWGVINALTDYETHKERKNSTYVSEYAFTQVTFDPTVISRMLSIVRDTVAA